MSEILVHSPPALPPSVSTERVAWRLTVWIAGTFSVLVGLGLLAGHWSARLDDPLHSPQLKEYKENLRANPADEPLKNQIRELDLSLRQRYFRQLSHKTSGSYLLIAGVVICVFAVNRLARIQRQPPRPAPASAAPQNTPFAVWSRWAVGAAGAIIASGLFLVSLGSPSAIPRGTAELDKLLGAETLASEAPSPGETLATGGHPQPTSGAPDAASVEELSQNWPRFRGPGGNGISPFTNAPTTWDAKTGAGVAWKTGVPAVGFNSPITWGGKVFISGGDAAKREVFCLDSKTGELRWRQAVANVPGSPAKLPEIPETTGFAASTMASDGRRLYVIFANGDVAALTFEGKVVWSKGFGPLKNPYGHAISLATWRDRLILQLDQGDNDEGKSKLYALDGKTGQTLWQQPRKVGASWASPIVIEAAGKAQIITLAVPWVIAYSANDGAELWRVECLNGEITPSPVFAAGLVIVASPSEKLLAIRPDGQGDVTKTQVAWTNEDNVPDVTSPIGNSELVFSVTTSGLVTCFDAKDGKKQWEHDLELECHASPCLAGNRLYILTQKGAMVVVEAARQYKEIARSDLPDAFHASPAFAADRVFLRGVTNVWCVGSKP